MFGIFGKRSGKAVQSTRPEPTYEMSDGPAAEHHRRRKDSPSAGYVTTTPEGTPMRDIESLITVDDPAWPHLQKALAESDAVVLPVDPERGRHSLWGLQVTAASPMGAVALHTGGIVADHGWVRLYGGGSEDLPSITEANGLSGPVSAPPGALVVGHDVLGGLFAIDGGALGIAPGEVCYFGPDTLTWDGLGGGYSAFLAATLGGGLEVVFEGLRWPGWQDEVAQLALSQGIALYPPPSTVEGSDVSKASRSVVSIRELLGTESC